MELEQIQEIAKKTLSEKRYNHSLEVMKRCEELAIIYGVDIEKAKKVGLAHDIAKEMTAEEKLQFANENNVILDELEIANLGLAHAKIGGAICKKEFGFTQDMVQAVENHTTGRPGMDLLSKILFVADATGLDRDWEDLEYARKLSETNLDDVVVYIIELNIMEKIQKKKQIHPNSILVRNEFLATSIT